MNIHKHALTYAAGIAICGIALGMGLFMAGQVMSLWNYLSYAFYIGIIIIAQKNWREKAREGFLSYGQAFGYSTWVAMYYSIIMAIWAFIFFQYIAHDEIVRYQSDELARRMAEAKEKYHLSDEMIEKQMEMSKRFMGPTTVVLGALFGNMFLLSIVNLVVSAFTKKDRPAPDSNSFPPLSN